MQPHLPAQPSRLQAGLSMVELMVAMVIALIGTIIMFQVFEVSEGIKRTTTAGGDSQQNGVIALYLMENDLRQAGNGFSETSLAGCTVLAYDAPPSGTPAPRNFTMTLVPVSITSGANAQTPDSFTVFYGSQHMVGAATSITQDMTTATSQVRTMNRYGFRTGDLVVLMEPASGKQCTMVEITSLPGSDYLAHDTGPYALDWAPGTPNKTARANPGGGLGVIYKGAGSANATRIFNLGNLYDRTGAYAYNGASMPVNNTYAVSATTLTVASAFSTAAASPVADNIVHMRALYALDDGVGDATVPYQTAGWIAGDGKIDRFVDAVKFATLGSPWQRIVAVRVVVVARSANPERGSGGPGSVCDTTVAAPTWSASLWPVQAPPLVIGLDVSADTDWKCYRYKTFETTVPVRNWIWKSS
jgi:type IV pilus assembly protein PilW